MEQKIVLITLVSHLIPHKKKLRIQLNKYHNKIIKSKMKNQILFLNLDKLHGQLNHNLKIIVILVLTNNNPLKFNLYKHNYLLQI